MKRIVSMCAVAGLFLMTAPAVRAQVSFSFSFGNAPPAPRAYRVPPSPGPDFNWIEGYWYPVNGRWRWHDGYWTRPPFANAYWVAPYWQGGRYFEGYWWTPRGQFDHDHRWDRDRGRDANHEYREHRDHDDHDRR